MVAFPSVERIVCHPISLRPALSERALKKGVIKPPGQYDRRVYLTDVGEALLKCIKRNGGRVHLVSSRGYLPLRLMFVCGGVSGEISFHRFGRSSYHTTIEVVFSGDEAEVENFRRSYLSELGRDPLNSPFIGFPPSWSNYKDEDRNK